MSVSLSACQSASKADNTTEQKSQTEQITKEITTIENADKGQIKDGNKALVAYFTYSENIGDTSGMSVDAVSSASLNRKTDNKSGNLQVMAQVIQEQAGADGFQILVCEPYDSDYDVMRERAYKELDNGSFPELQSTVENLADYDVVYLGTPVWSGKMPRPVASFLKENDLSGKTIIPFGINLGSGFGSILQEMRETSPDANIIDGFTINASTDNDEVRNEFTDWLNNQQ